MIPNARASDLADFIQSPSKRSVNWTQQRAASLTATNRFLATFARVGWRRSRARSHNTQMRWHQTQIRLKPRSRGFHLVTNEVVAGLPELAQFKVGLAHVFIQHTSASLAINENADPDVRGDMERW